MSEDYVKEREISAKESVEEKSTEEKNPEDTPVLLSEEQPTEALIKKEKTDDRPEKKVKKFSYFARKGFRRLTVKTICYCAVLVALSVIANSFTVYFNFAGSNALSFTYTVCFLGGAFFGPFAGFLVGALGDLIGWLCNPAGGAFNPLITLTSGLLGLLPGLIFFSAKKLIKDKKKFDKLLPVWTVVSFVLTWIVCTNLNTVIFFYSYIYGKSMKYTALGMYYVYRIPFQTAFWAINLFLSLMLAYPLKKILKL